MRHKDTVDCEFWGKLLALIELDEKREKLREYEDQQYVAGTRRVTTINYSKMFSKSEAMTENEGGAISHDESHSRQEGVTAATSSGRSVANTHTDGVGNVHTDAHNHTDNVRESFHNAHAQMRASADGSAQSDASSQTSSDATQVAQSKESSLSYSANETAGSSKSSAFNWARSKQTGHTSQRGVSYNQTLTPIYAWRRVVKFLELMALDDQEKLKGRDVAMLPVGSGFMYAAGHLPFYLEVPFPKERLLESSSRFQENLTNLMDRLTLLPCYEMGQKILQYRHTWMKIALKELTRLQNQLAQQQRLGLPPLDDPTTGV